MKNNNVGLLSDGLMKPDEAGQYLALSPSWLAKLRCGGGGPRYVKLARRVLYKKSDLDAWISAHRVGSTCQKSRAQLEGWA